MHHKPRSKFRVWKGILGIRDLIQIRCGIRENAKYLDGIRDLTAPREAGFSKIWVRDAGFFACVSFVKTKNLIVAHISINFTKLRYFVHVSGNRLVLRLSTESLINHFYSILQLNVSQLANH